MHGHDNVEVTVRAHDTAPGRIFVAPKNGPEEDGPGQDGAMILDEDGQVVWFHPARSEEKDVMNFKVQRYRGEPVLTWWEPGGRVSTPATAMAST